MGMRGGCAFCLYFDNLTVTQVVRSGLVAGYIVMKVTVVTELTADSFGLSAILILQTGVYMH